MIVIIIFAILIAIYYNQTRCVIGKYYKYLKRQLSGRKTPGLYFIHNPKTAGSSIAKIARDHGYDWDDQIIDWLYPLQHCFQHQRYNYCNIGHLPPAIRNIPKDVDTF